MMIQPQYCLKHFCSVQWRTVGQQQHKLWKMHQANGLDFQGGVPSNVCSHVYLVPTCWDCLLELKVTSFLLKFKIFFVAMFLAHSPHKWMSCYIFSCYLSRFSRMIILVLKDSDSRRGIESNSDVIAILLHYWCEVLIVQYSPSKSPFVEWCLHLDPSSFLPNMLHSFILVVILISFFFKVRTR